MSREASQAHPAAPEPVAERAENSDEEGPEPMTDTLTVPRWASDEMIEAAIDCGPVGCCILTPAGARDIWEAMLAASPEGDGGGWRELVEALSDAVGDLEQTLRWRDGWECSEDELLGHYRTVLAKHIKPQPPASRGEG